MLLLFLNAFLLRFPVISAVDPALARERQYWRAAAALELGRASEALVEAERGLELLGDMSNDELRWRLAALGAIAARALAQADKARAMHATTYEALAQLRSNCTSGVEIYEERSDLAELKARFGPA